MRYIIYKNMRQVNRPVAYFYYMYERLFERGVGLTRHYFIKHHVQETR